jgi:hypothetical protein
MDIHFRGITAFSCPIECSDGARLFLNYSVDAGTVPFSVALQDEDRTGTLDGYTHEECVPLAGDDLRAPIVWKHRETLPTGRRFTIEIRTGPETRFYAAYLCRAQERGP